MAQRYLYLKPVASKVLTEVIPATTPEGVAPEEMYKLVSEEVSDKESTCITLTKDTKIQFEFEFIKPADLKQIISPAVLSNYRSSSTGTLSYDYYYTTTANTSLDLGTTFTDFPQEDTNGVFGTACKGPLFLLLATAEWKKEAEFLQSATEPVRLTIDCILSSNKTYTIDLSQIFLLIVYESYALDYKTKTDTWQDHLGLFYKKHNGKWEIQESNDLLPNRKYHIINLVNNQEE